MKISQFLLVSLFLLTGHVQAQDATPAKLPTLKPGEAVTTFAGGCFWAQEEAFDQIKGVREVVSGYAGGNVKNPTYQEVGTDQTGHAEAVQVYYDPKVISYQELLVGFLPPTTRRRSTGRDPIPGAIIGPWLFTGHSLKSRPFRTPLKR